jgi:hypothetical protein
MYDVKPTRHVRRCGRCGGAAVTTGICGPTNICDACADKLLAIIWGKHWPAIRDHTRNHGRRAA